MSHFRFPSFRAAGLLAACLLLAGAAAADDVTIIKKHMHEGQAKFVLATGDGAPEVFEIDGGLEIGESRQFFTEGGMEIVVLRTEAGFDVTIDGEPIETGATTMKIMHLGDGDGTDHQVRIENGSKLKVIRLGGDGDILVEGGDADVDVDADMGVKVIRLKGEGDQHIEIGEAGHKAIFITTGDEETEHVWISADDAHAYSFGDQQTALEHLESSGALDKLDEETRAKVLEALRAAENEAQNP